MTAAARLAMIDIHEQDGIMWQGIRSSRQASLLSGSDASPTKLCWQIDMHVSGLPQVLNVCVDTGLR